MAKAPVSKQRIIDLLVLAFSNSEVKDLVGTDALRSVLAIRYHSMVEGKKLMLEPLWSLLCDQPDFESEAAAPPLCKFKSWEEHVGLEVVLPETLSEIDADTISEWAARIDVAAVELKNVLRATEPAAKKKTGKHDSLADLIVDASAEHAADRKKKSKRKVSARMVGWEIPLAIVAVLTLGFAGYAAYQFGFAGPSFEKFSGNFGQIPVKNVKKLGDQVGGELTDSGWLSSPRNDRREQLATVLDNLHGAGVNVIYVMSEKKEVYATASYRRDGSIKVEFLK